MNIFKKTIQTIARPFYRALLKPSFRYSQNFEVMHNSFSRIELETVMEQSLKFAYYSKLEGDYFEFGVAEGGSLVMFYHLARTYLRRPFHMYAFDSFKGLPEINGVDAEGFKHFQKGEFACGLEDVKSNMTKKGVDPLAATFIAGWYHETLNNERKKRLPIKKAAIVFIDVDLYESTVPVLDFLTDYLQTGTIIIFDDWFTFRADPNRGEQRAVREWLEKNPHIGLAEFYHYSWKGNSFIVHVKNEA